MDDIHEELIKTALECFEKAKETEDVKEQAELFKTGMEMLELASKFETKEERAVKFVMRFLGRVFDIGITLVPILVKARVLDRHTDKMIAFETGNVATYSATRGLEGPLKMPSIF